MSGGGGAERSAFSPRSIDALGYGSNATVSGVMLTVFMLMVADAVN